MDDLRRRLDERLAEQMERLRVPGVAVGVVRGGQEIRLARGVTNAEHPLPVDDRTLFQVASNSKPFTATLVLSLAEEGRIDLDAPVRRYLPAFRLSDDAHTGRVTVRHLLTHLVGWDGDALFVRPPPERALDAIFEPMSKARQLVPPGTHWSYSNAAFSVAGRLVEVIAGAPFLVPLRERILEPLGMRHTYTLADEVVTHRVAAPHLTLPDRDDIVLRGGGWQPHWEQSPHDAPAAALISCVDDLLRWLRFQLGSLEVERPPLAADALARMHEPQLEPWNAEAGHALGWSIWYANGTPVRNHGGLTAGYCSFTLFSRELDLGCVVLTNSMSGGRLHNELSRWLLAEATGSPVEPPEPLAKQPALSGYAGSYSGAFGMRCVRVVDGELEIATEPHSTEDGSWQPPATPPFRCAFYAPERAVVLGPEDLRGGLLDFDPAGDASWLRYGGRIHTRV